MAWYDPAWGYRTQIDIDNTKVAGDETDFPVLVTEDNLPAGFWSNVDAAGDDIVFTSDDELTKLKREVVNIDTSGQTLEAWVKVPSLSSSATTTLYLYYGNAAATETNDTDTWRSEYKGVYHCQEDPTAGGNPVLDSTSNTNHMQTSGFSAGDYVDLAPGKGYNFDKTDNACYVTGITGINDQDVSLSVYGKMPASQTQIACGVMMTDKDSVGAVMYNNLDLRNSDSAARKHGYFGGTSDQALTTNTYSGNDLTSIAGTDVSTHDDRWTYKDGGYVANDKKNSTVIISGTEAQDTFCINYYHNSSAPIYCEGLVSEARFYIGGILTNNWFSTEYETIRNPSTFYSAGAEEPQPVVGGQGRIVMWQTTIMRR